MFSSFFTAPDTAGLAKYDQPHLKRLHVPEEPNKQQDKLTKMTAHFFPILWLL